MDQQSEEWLFCQHSVAPAWLTCQRVQQIDGEGLWNPAKCSATWNLHLESKQPCGYTVGQQVTLHACVQHKWLLVKTLWIKDLAGLHGWRQCRRTKRRAFSERYQHLSPCANPAFMCACVTDSCLMCVTDVYIICIRLCRLMFTICACSIDGDLSDVTNILWS